MKDEEIPLTLDDGPERSFEKAMLEIDGDSSNKINKNKVDLENMEDPLQNDSFEATNPSAPKKARPNSLALVPWSGENAKDYFCFRNGLISSAIEECKTELLTEDGGEIIGCWLLTEISFWDSEKERLIILTDKHLYTIKYDFIALKQLDQRKTPLDMIDTIIVGELSYPATSLIPSRNINGVRLMWGEGRPVSFLKKWNPFEKDIPFTTFTSHPLMWHKDEETKERRIFSVDDFVLELKKLFEDKIQTLQCSLQHRPILLENYIGVGALIHNKNSLGFFKVRGKFSF
ncbi:tumor protein p63-regulated gene 1-like protein isoform X2 [Halyomorpha halys]|uniref:tumor protein p63-regulated gene 1-like protein isoform X2 n=1 Tax=Halyomorpha halys TaxID=286706 RepID=UPI0006D4F9BB|nr:tumor protein p63-regulated gene 1-like protein isoform X2 [Halyomorpha halys]